MEYLKKKFSIGMSGNQQFAKNWDKIFKKKCKCKNKDNKCTNSCERKNDKKTNNRH